MSDTLRERAIEAACSTYFGSEAWSAIQARDDKQAPFFRNVMGQSLDAALSVLLAGEQERPA